MASDGDIIKLARRFDALTFKQREILDRIRESDHPNADALADALESECETLAWATHVIHDHLEHPDRYEINENGIGRKKGSE